MNRVVLGLICGLVFGALPPSVSAGSVHVDPLVDGITLGTSLVFAGLSELVLPILPPIRSLGAADQSLVDPLDGALLYPYSKGFDAASTVLEITAAVMPGVLGFVVPTADLLPVGVVYLESLSFAVGAKNVLKYLLPRYRPYVYTGGAPGVNPSDDNQSFPSGHATVAFAAATAGVALFALYAPDSPYFWPFTIASYGVATVTAAFRVTAGMHFLTDVAAGAALGTVCGLLPPLLHARRPKEKSSSLSFDVGAGGVLVRYSY
jgi:membrane-associated phospholipid phosphatase